MRILEELEVLQFKQIIYQLPKNNSKMYSINNDMIDDHCFIDCHNEKECMLSVGSLSVAVVEGMNR